MRCALSNWSQNNGSTIMGLPKWSASVVVIVLPLFWDQFDNAQRMTELGLGVRLPTYDFEDEQLRDAVAQLLVDGDLRRRMAVEGEKIRARDGKTKAADLIEETVLRSRTHD